MKKLFSVILAFLMFIGILFSFGVDTYATDDPMVSMIFPYVEEYFAFPDNSRFQSVEFQPLYSGYYIIQVFGGESLSTDPDAEVLELSLWHDYSEEYILYAGAYTGYDSGRLFYTYLHNDPYTLELWFSFECEQARLSITHVGDIDYIEQYEDIVTYSPGTFDFTFVYDTQYQAQVALIQCTSSESRYYNISISGCSYAAVFLMDPTSTNQFGGAMFHSSDGGYYLDAYVPYYLVVFLDNWYGDAPAIGVESITVTVSFT